MSKHTIKEKENSLLEIHVTVEWDELLPFKKEALQELGKEVEIDGFRKGKVPEKILIEKIGNEKILFEAAEQAIKKIYPKIIIDENIDAIGRPEITINKLAENNPFEFKAEQAVLPKIELPEYKDIAKKINNKKEEPITVTDKEVDDVLEEVKKNREQMETQKEDEKKEIKIDDAFAKSLGEFENLSALKNQIKENILKEKTHKANDKRRLEIIDAVLEKVDIPVPEILVENEQEKMLHDLEARVSGSGLEFDAYLDHIKKTKEDLKKEWKTQAKKRVLVNLLLNEIAKKENIKPDQEKVQKEVAEILTHYPTAHEENVRLYVESLFTYDKVYELLDSQK